MSEEIKFLKEHIKDICIYKGLQGELTYDVPLEILKRICVALDYLQQENKQLNEINEEHKKLNGQLREENKKYKDVIDKLNNKINLLKTCEDKPKEDIIYPHWEICNETEQELLNILKEVSDE